MGTHMDTDTRARTHRHADTHRHVCADTDMSTRTSAQAQKPAEVGAGRSAPGRALHSGVEPPFLSLRGPGPGPGPPTLSNMACEVPRSAAALPSTPRLPHTSGPRDPLGPWGSGAGQLSASPLPCTHPRSPRPVSAGTFSDPALTNRAAMSLRPSDSGLSPHQCAGSTREQAHPARSPLTPGTTRGTQWDLSQNLRMNE